MALKILMLTHKRSRLQAERNAIPDRSNEFATRQAQLEQAISEATTEDEEAVVTAEVEAFDQERDGHNAEIQRLDGAIAELTRQIQAMEADAPTPNPASAPTDPNHPTTAPPVERKDDNTMPNTRGRYFGMTRSQFEELVKRDDSKQWLTHLRNIIRSGGSVSGANLLIPEYFIGLIRENVPLYSKLYKHFNVRRLAGTGRQNIMGTIPEGVWTEMCGSLNELVVSFSSVQLDGYTVGGFVAVCNAHAEDSDIDLAVEVLTTVTKSIALGLDKAGLYGTGTMMPLGIVPRLAQSAKPEGWKHNLAWSNASGNLISLGNKTGLDLFKALIEAAGKINSDYGSGELFWAMNRKTKMKILAEALAVNSAGAIVSGMDNSMPVVGGDIETLNFIPDDVIIGGCGDMYTLLERAGITLERYKETRAIQQQTLFVGTARYDGMPVIADAFVAIGLGTSKPSANAVPFAADTANAAS